MIPETVLDRPIVWETFRFFLDFFWGLYRKRFAIIRGWSAIGPEDSVLEIGCGIGHYSSLPCRSYLGIDSSSKYIAYAASRPRRKDVEFRTTTSTDLVQSGRRFDVVLMVDFLHHLSDAECLSVLRDSRLLAKGRVILFEPVKNQDNPLGQWLIDGDRGRFMRPESAILKLLADASLSVTENLPVRIGPMVGRGILAAPKAS